MKTSRFQTFPIRFPVASSQGIKEFNNNTQGVIMGQLRGLGYIPDLPKIEDYDERHKNIAPLLHKTQLAHRTAGTIKKPGVKSDTAPAPQALPAQVDLQQWCSPIEDQGQLGSCTANAATGILEYFENRTKGTYTEASRLFLYKAERDLLGWIGDTGAYLRTAMEALVLFGAPPERYWPYDIANFDVEPTAFCYAFGANYQSILYFRLDPVGTPDLQQVLYSIKEFLAAGFPSMFGFPVYPEYDNPLPGGLIGYPTPSQQSRGGHANVAVGYDDNLMIGADMGALLVRNSWGTGWANNGYGWLSYKYVTQGLANDWWSMISAKWVDTGQFA
jgi:C1A family cysteine protease